MNARPTRAPAEPTALEAYDMDRRRQARAEGRPIERTSFPSIYGRFAAEREPAVSLVWVDGGSLRMVVPGVADEPVAPRPDLLDLATRLPTERDEHGDTVEAFCSRLVVAERAALGRLNGLLTVWASGKDEERAALAAQVRRRIAYSTALTNPTRVVTLTRALATRFWLPSNLDADSFGAWRRAFGFGLRASDASVLAELVRLASEGPVHKDAGQAFRNESFGMSAAGWPTRLNDARAFHNATQADLAAQTIFAEDTALRGRNLLDGSVTALTVVSVDGRKIIGQTTGSVTQRAGKKARITVERGSRPGPFPVSIKGVGAAMVGGQDVLKVRLDLSDRKANQPGPISHGDTLYMSDDPFYSFAGVQSDSRWLVKPQDRMDRDREAGVARREVPLDVIVAGGREAVA